MTEGPVVTRQNDFRVFLRIGLYCCTDKQNEQQEFFHGIYLWAIIT